MNIRRTRSLLWLTTVGLLAAAATGVIAHRLTPVQVDTPAIDVSQERDATKEQRSVDAYQALDRAALQQVASRDIRQRLFDPPVIAPKPPPPKPLPPIELLTTILRSETSGGGSTSGVTSGATSGGGAGGGDALAWVRDGQITRKVVVGDTIGPDNNSAIVSAIQADRLLLTHEGQVVEVTRNAGNKGGGR